MNTDVLRHLADKYNEEIQRHEQDLGKGNARDYSEYKKTAGIIQGLRIANGIVTEINESLMAGEDDDD